METVDGRLTLRCAFELAVRRVAAEYVERTGVFGAPEPGQMSLGNGCLERNYFTAALPVFRPEPYFVFAAHITPTFFSRKRRSLAHTDRFPELTNLSSRIKSAEESARREREISRRAVLTQVADDTRPRHPHLQADHYRRHLADAHIVIERLQEKIAALEADLAKSKANAAYILSRSVPKAVAEAARLKAAAAMRYRAADIAEGRDGIPTPISDAIDHLPLPRPRFTK